MRGKGFCSWMLFCAAILSTLGDAHAQVLKPRSAFVEAPWAGQMDKLVKELGRRFPGRMAVYVSDPWRGYRWGHNEDEPFYLASGIKTTFMVEVFRQRERGELQFSEKLTFGPDDLRDGAPRLNKQKSGARLEITTLLDWMMRSSDNAASDMLAKRVGVANINPGLLDEGIPGFTPVTYLIDVRRSIYRELDVHADDLTPLEVRTIRWTRIWEPQINKLTQLLERPRGTFNKAQLMAAYDAFYERKVNCAPMSSVGLLFEKMARGELVSKTASEEMIELMSAARTSTHRLLGRLPKGTTVAHKTGSQFKKLCDLGIIFLPDTKPLIVTACMENGPVPRMEDNVARLARKAYDLAVADHRDGK